MWPSVKFRHPILSWLLASERSLGDIHPNAKKGLSPRIRMYFGIQYASSGSVFSSYSIHLTSSSTFSSRSRVLSLSGHNIKCAAVSRLPQFGQRSSGSDSPDYIPTLTRVPQYPDVCLDRHTLYMSDLFFIAWSRCSQSTSLNRSFVHLSLDRVCR